MELNHILPREDVVFRELMLVDGANILFLLPFKIVLASIFLLVSLGFSKSLFISEMYVVLGMTFSN
jgi:hypothetical protein